MSTTVNLPYLMPRVVRHFLPEPVVRFLLRRSLIIHPGTETSAPQEAVRIYQESLLAKGVSLTGKRILDFGYGGRLAVGCGLLDAGASHVVLCEKSEFLDHRSNISLLEQYPQYLKRDGDKVFPNPDTMTLYHGDIRQVQPFPPVDVVLSCSVYEHLDDVAGITTALRALTKAGGVHLHLVDLRDHFFKYPFEMLCYPEKTWHLWLDPTSHLNRYRLWDYRQVFETQFPRVEIDILQQDEEAFNKVRLRIRPEFLSGDDAVDAATTIHIFAAVKSN